MRTSGYVALIVAILIGRILNERGFRTLNDEEKLRLMNGFSKMRAYSLIPLVILIGGYWLLMKHPEIDTRILTVGYFGALVSYIVVKAIWTQKKLVALNLSPKYRRYFGAAQSLSLLGIAWFFYALFAEKLANL